MYRLLNVPFLSLLQSLPLSPLWWEPPALTLVCLSCIVFTLNFHHWRGGGPNLFADHEAVSALLRVSPQNESIGTFGDSSSKRPGFMTEETVRDHSSSPSNDIHKYKLCDDARLGKGFILSMRLWGKEHHLLLLFPFTIKSRSVASHQKSYMLLAIFAFLAFAATFAQILLLDR